jgi:hypothetical protein
MLSDRALSPVVHDHGEVIRLEESPRSVRYRQGVHRGMPPTAEVLGDQLIRSLS